MSPLDRLIAEYKSDCKKLSDTLGEQLKGLAEIRSLHLHILVIKVINDNERHNEEAGSLRTDEWYQNPGAKDRVELQRCLRGADGGVLHTVTQ